MQVQSLEPGFANVTGRGELRRVNTALVGECSVGQWLLVFLSDAREILDVQRAAEVNAALDLLDAVMDPGALREGNSPGFTLPSSMDMAALQQLTGN